MQNQPSISPPIEGFSPLFTIFTNTYTPTAISSTTKDNNTPTLFSILSTSTDSPIASSLTINTGTSTSFPSSGFIADTTGTFTISSTTSFTSSSNISTNPLSIPPSLGILIPYQFILTTL
ncbi:hypothetical protein AYI68_g4028 [Smittium mucronatum]|uniref:Uncharacterized protein n=1 Tax=Smittium mucronatum TaxID=133383 RepID=A0A1R0GY81_9FUNG|nr:hypothetical protein AYI68_g4028 [Smittium mucronatum]